MSSRLSLLTLAIVSFGLLTAVALYDVGYFGIFEPHFQSWGGGQVLADLAILALLACVWMVRDARTSGINPWPFVLVTFAAGSFGPLLYLLVRESRAGEAASA